MTRGNLGATGEKIIRALAAAGQRRISVEELSKLSGVGVDIIYRKLEDPDFKGLFLETLKNAIVSETPEIIYAFIEKAKKGQFKQGKLLLEISGLYTEKKEVSAEVKTTEVPFKTDEERKKFIEATFAGYIKPDSTEEYQE